MKKFNEQISTYKDSSVLELEPLLHSFQNSLCIKETDQLGALHNKASLREVAFFSRYQRSLKKMKLYIRADDPTLIRDKRSKYDELEFKSTERKSVYANMQPLDLLFKGKISYMMFQLES